MWATNKIDVHHHPAPANYTAAMKRTSGIWPVASSWTVDKSLEDMHLGGVTTAILSVPGTPDPALAREWNEHMARLRKDHPSRFGTFAALPARDIDASLREIEYAFGQLEADGIGLMTNCGDKWLGDPHYAPVLNELDRRRAVVFVHPAVADCCKPFVTNESYFQPTELPADTTRAITRIMFSGAARRYPNIRFIFAHGGGTVPFVLERLARMPTRSPEVAAAVPDGVEHELRRFYYELAQASHPGALAALTRMVPASRLLFGTDYPFRTSDEHARAIEGYGFDAADLKWIARDTAVELIPRLAHAVGSR
jgi:predicted TIM-barrel fold metal-dependent hydrolase